MKPALLCTLVAAAALAQDAAPAGEPWSGSVDLGYRWMSDLAGNNLTYRSIINLGEGPKLLGADLDFRDPSARLFDTLTLGGIGWGGDPYNTARLEAWKKSRYRFRLDYRNIAYFNAVPSFANPFTGPGVVNQHSYDTHRRLADLNLEIRPGARVVPYLGYSRNSQRGTGLTDFVLDVNEYPVASLLRNQTDHYRGGVRAMFRRFQVTIEEGGTVFKDDQQVHNTARNLGDRNFPRVLPFLGRTLYLDDLLQAYGMRGTAPYTQASITGAPFAWLDLQGQFVYRMGSTSANYIQSNSGQFVNLNPLLFYTSQRELAAGVVNRPHTSAIVGAEARPLRRVRIVESWTTDRLHTDTRQTIERVLDQRAFTIPGADRLVDNYNQQSVDVLVEALPGLTLRGGHRYVWGDTTVRAPSFLGTAPATARLARHAGVGAASYRRGSRLSANFEFEGGRADQIYYRTSLRDYSKTRARVRYQVAGGLSVTWNLNTLDNDNPAPDVNLKYRSRSNGATVEWLPGGGGRISLIADYARTSVRSEISYLVPQNFTTDRFPYAQNAHEAAVRLAASLPAIGGRVPRLTAGGTLFRSSGSRPTPFYRPVAALAVPVAREVSVTGEWRWYGFGEPFYLDERFRAHQFTLGVRIAR
jgi:hypothetical protein